MSPRTWLNRALLVLSVVLFFVLLIRLTGEVADAVIAALLAIVGLVVFLFEPVREFVLSDEFGADWVLVMLSSVVLLSGGWLVFFLLQDLATTEAPLPTSTPDELATQVADAIYAVQTQTATMWTPTPTANVSAAVEMHLTETAAAATSTPTEGGSYSPTFIPTTMSPTQSSTTSSTMIMTLTATPNSTATPTFIPAGVEPNWTSVVQEINGIPFVYVPAGCFMMGSTNEQVDAAVELCEADLDTDSCRALFSDEQPSHEVCLSAFWISQTEVANDQYRACVDAGVCEPPGNRVYFDNPSYANHPVVGVDWYQAEAYARWVGGNLPTEAQWEYAARGPAGHVYPWGDEGPTCELANTGSCERVTTEVSNYPNGASWVGALDMAGNVLEWVADWCDRNYYATLPLETLDPIGPDNGDARVYRSGAFYSYQWEVRAAARSGYVPHYGPDFAGFRVAAPIFP